MTKINNIEKVLTLKIEVLYDIEKELEEALPKMAKACKDTELSMGILSHLEETKEQITRLESIFEMLQAEPKKTKSEGIRGIINDAESVMDMDAPDTLKDGMIASAARYAENYEIAGYTSAIEEAEALGLDNVIELLSQTLEEEEEADATLLLAMEKAFKVQ
ncbi:MAG TPA: DUF892 family protein [Candidatus Paceibacterota bacterium]|nr:DUF892 family protein [Candidatus Paceibacterota bacterium]